jgi:peptidoglycan/LPS O-acetylase OafA/YrhL
VVNNPPNNRLAELDSFRGLSAMAVVLYHFTTRFQELFPVRGSLPFSFPLGYLGVQFFFIISGFVISMTVERSTTPAGFALSRFSRLFPAYWLAASVTFGMMCLFPFPNNIPKSVGGFDYIANLTMLQGFFKIPNVDGVYWSLTYELGFYAAISAMLWFNKMNRLLLIAGTMLAGQALFVFWPKLIPSPLHLLLVMNGYTYLFVAGMALYRLHKNRRDSGWWCILGACLISDIMLFWQKKELLFSVFFPAFVLIFVLGLNGQLSFLRRPIFRWLGAISYSLYLIHEFLGWRIILFSNSLGINHTSSMAIALAVVLLLATAMTNWVEQPAMRWIRSKRAASSPRNDFAPHPVKKQLAS